MAIREERWGGLTVYVAEPESAERVELNVVLSHGYGAPGSDLVPLATMFHRFAPELRDTVRFVFPEAPLDLGEVGLPGGRAWWHLNLWKLQEAVAIGQYRDLPNESPDGLPAAREAMFSLLKECLEATRIPLSRTVLGGFSQGAMLSTDAALHLPEAPAGLVILSGSLINQPVWLERMKTRSGLPVFQSHGRNDPLLPFDLATRLRDELQAAGNPVTFYDFPGGHEIPFEAMELAAGFLQRLPSA